jgi:hypothetical protein
VTVLPLKMPALFTITSSRPKDFTAVATADSISRSLLTSATRVRVRSPGSSRATFSIEPL